MRDCRGPHSPLGAALQTDCQWGPTLGQGSVSGGFECGGM